MADHDVCTILDGKWGTYHKAGREVSALIDKEIYGAPLGHTP